MPILYCYLVSKITLKLSGSNFVDDILFHDDINGERLRLKRVKFVHWSVGKVDIMFF